MRAVVAGAGVGGAAAALLLARGGADVVLLEPDLPRDGTVDELCRRPRPGAPQSCQPHNVMPLGRRVLADHLPDVLADVLARGAQLVDMAAALPPGDGDREAERDLVALACRRPLLEAALARALRAQPRIDVRPAAAVDLRPDGVVTADGTVTADLVVDAAGRRSPLVAALTAAGVEVRAEREECGTTYLSRHYRLHDEAPPGPMLFGLATRAEATCLGAGLFRGDDRTFSVIVGTPPADREMRRALVDPTAYAAVLGALPPVADWTRPDVATPISDVLVMGGLANVVVRTGAPPLPYVGVGDTVLTTNPRLGWGMSLALSHAALLAQALERSSVADAAAEVRDAVHEDAVLRWRASVAEDRVRRRWWAGEGWDVSPAARLVAAGAEDRAVATAAARRLGLLDRPDDHLSSPHVRISVASAEEELRRTGPPTGPTREELLALARGRAGALV